jgi:hypothetical protein
MNSPQNKIFIFFWNNGQHPLKFYKHVVKSRMQENNFFVFKKSMLKHIFFKLRIFVFFFYKKRNSKYVRVLAVCMKTYIYIYIYIFVTLRRKSGILNTRFVFLQYKNTKTTK